MCDKFISCESSSSAPAKGNLFFNKEGFMLNQEVLDASITECADGALILWILWPPRKVILNHDESALAWVEIFAEVRKRYPHRDFQFIEHGYIAETSPGHTSSQQFLQSILAIPISSF